MRRASKRPRCQRRQVPVTEANIVNCNHEALTNRVPVFLFDDGVDWLLGLLAVTLDEAAARVAQPPRP